MVSLLFVLSAFLDDRGTSAPGPSAGIEPESASTQRGQPSVLSARGRRSCGAGAGGRPPASLRRSRQHRERLVARPRRVRRGDRAPSRSANERFRAPHTRQLAGPRWAMLGGSCSSRPARRGWRQGSGVGELVRCCGGRGRADLGGLSRLSCAFGLDLTRRAAECGDGGLTRRGWGAERSRSSLSDERLKLDGLAPSKSAGAACHDRCRPWPTGGWVACVAAARGGDRAGGLVGGC